MFPLCVPMNCGVLAHLSTSSSLADIPSCPQPPERHSWHHHSCIPVPNIQSSGHTSASAHRLPLLRLLPPHRYPGLLFYLRPLYLPHKTPTHPLTDPFPLPDPQTLPPLYSSSHHAAEASYRCLPDITTEAPIPD